MVDRRSHTLKLRDGTAFGLGPRTSVMGVLNVTPNSFSDGGRHLAHDAAIVAARRMAEAGADWIDVGGESSRPGAAEVDASEEADRILPVIEALTADCAARISVDTVKASVARQALACGAQLINDISALGDPEMAPLLARTGAPVVLMHMRGRPETMQRDTHYEDLVGEVGRYLEQRAAVAIEAGIADDRIIVDPGIGFGKSLQGNLTLLRHLPRLSRRPLLIGASRKSFIGTILDLPVDDRLEGSLAIAGFASAQGAHMVRVHDVTATLRVVRMIDAIRASGADST